MWPCSRGNIHSFSPLVCEVRVTDRWVTFELVCCRALCDMPGMCPHLLANHVTASGKHALCKPKQSVCAGLGLSVMVYILWRCVNAWESVMGARVMDDFIWRDKEEGTGGRCVCLCEKGHCMIRIFLSNLCEEFQGLCSYINCCHAGVHVIVSGVSPHTNTLYTCCHVAKKHNIWIRITNNRTYLV